jgi:hypothetical protein
MTGFDRTDFQRITVSALGALLISAACITAAVSPAKAAEVTAPNAMAWKAEVEKRIDRAMITPPSVVKGAVMSEVVMRFDDHGEFRNASLRKSSGLPDVDREALRIANHISYPALPTHLQGKPQTVAMQIIFGSDARQVAERQEKVEAVAVARASQADSNRAVARIAGQPES